MLMLCGGVAVGAPAPPGYSQEPTDKDLALVRERLAQARAALLRLKPANETARQDLENRVAGAEAALARYEQVSRRGARRKRYTGSLYVAGATVFADDISGIGAADDVLFPLLAVGLLATYLLTQPPPTPQELTAAWKDLLLKMEAVGQEAERLEKVAGRRRTRPPRKDCREHAKRCLETPLGNRSSAGFGRSICHECLRYCEGQGIWHDFTSAGLDCRWWRFLDAGPQGPAHD